jgi:hypothetical protein
MQLRTAMFIDVEGFGPLYGKDGADSMWGLSDLMEGIFRLGREAPRIGISRMFAHHLGDGFVLIDDSGTDNVSRLAAVAVALHQFVLIKAGHFCASAIARGEMADVVGCYPSVVLEARTKDGVVPLAGGGLMTIFPVMGTGLINTYKLLKREKRAVVVLPAEHERELSAQFCVAGEGGKIYINWIDSESPVILQAREILHISGYSREKIRELFDSAVDRNASPAEWIARTRKFI